MSETFRTTVLIEATPEEVFEHFVKPELLVRWMGDVARLDVRPGGVFSVDINGVLIRGEYVRIERPRLLEVSWGEMGSASMPPGATRLVVTFTAQGASTLVELVHTGLTIAEAQKHAIGWPHFLERLGIAGAGNDPGVDPWRTSPPPG